MQPLSFEVEDTFRIQGLLVLLPGATSEQNVAVGDQILITRPDGSTVEADVQGLEMGSPNPRRIYPIAVGSNEVGDVPVGSLVTAGT